MKHYDHPAIDRQIAKEFRERLERRKEFLQKIVIQLKKEQQLSATDLGELSHYPFHFLELGALESRRDQRIRLRYHAETQLQQIEKALHKLEIGTYGICEETGIPIGLERLRVLPETPYSKDVQEEKDAEVRKMRDTDEAYRRANPYGATGLGDWIQSEMRENVK